MTGDFAWERNAWSERYWSGEDEILSRGNIDARLPVTQSDDPLSGGHFALGASKAPLFANYQCGKCIEAGLYVLTPGPPEKVVE
jgi:hypothetical protein